MFENFITLERLLTVAFLFYKGTVSCIYDCDGIKISNFSLYI